ncbi:MAG: hypothetical protein IJT35_07890 [Paludibacteraceae bacterium]|nr:hypothetical protein [Paludibacteraceae bacterium]
MKKVILFVAAAVMTLSAMAGKKVVIAVGDFESAAAAEENVEKVRENVIAGLSAVEHLQMIDSKDGLGADYLITGNVLSYDMSRYKNEQGEIWYKTTMSYSITATNIKDGTTISKTFKYDGTDGLFNVKYGLSQDPNTSKAKVLCYIGGDMKIFAFENFALAGQIVEADYKLDKKGKLTECYITLGSDDGVAVKTKFHAYLGKIIAGRQTTSEADVTIEVVEVVAGDLARCKVSGKEADKVAAAIQAYANDPQNALPVIVKMIPPKDKMGWDC